VASRVSAEERISMLAKTRLALAATAVTALLVAAGCSSSGSNSSGSASAAGGSGKAASGSVIKIGMIANVGTAVDYPDAVAGAKAQVRALNARGGINGHKVELDFCNEALDPNKANACARKMVADHVIATASNEVVTAEQAVNQILAKAGIANVGPNSYSVAATDPNSYPLYGTQIYINAAQIAYATKLGAKNIAWVRLDAPLTVGYIDFYKKAIPALGGTYGAVVNIPQVTADLSPQAATLVNSHPDAVNSNASAPADIAIWTQMAHLGYKGYYIASGDLLNLKQFQSLGSLASQVLVVSAFPPVGAVAQVPGLAQFQKDMRAEAASGDNDVPPVDEYTRQIVMNSYLSVLAIGNIANQAKATDAAAFKKAIGQAKNVDMAGIIAPWNPNSSINAKLPRVSDGSFYFFRLIDGKVKLESTQPTDVTSTVNAGLGS
jgi:ABC-type branched-subunit amino acid transport system substrate-binding protein